jgi:hypothetical protein
MWASVCFTALILDLDGRERRYRLKNDLYGRSLSEATSRGELLIYKLCGAWQLNAIAITCKALLSLYLVILHKSPLEQ